MQYRPKIYVPQAKTAEESLELQLLYSPIVPVILLDSSLKKRV
jgi:hypothetical protein